MARVGCRSLQDVAGHPTLPPRHVSHACKRNGPNFRNHGMSCENYGLRQRVGAVVGTDVCPSVGNARHDCPKMQFTGVATQSTPITCATTMVHKSGNNCRWLICRKTTGAHRFELRPRSPSTTTPSTAPTHPALIPRPGWPTRPPGEPTTKSLGSPPPRT